MSPNPKGITRVTHTAKQKAARARLVARLAAGGRATAAKASAKSIKVYGARTRQAQAAHEWRRKWAECSEHGRQPTVYLENSRRWSLICCGREPE